MTKAISENNLKEEKKIENVSEQKYLGFTISEDGSNQKNIEAKTK